MYNEQTMAEQNNNHDPEFLKEKLKQRPLNRRKLLRRMLLTVLMAVIFGTVASVTIILLEPAINKYLYPPEDELDIIPFPEDIIEVDEEILPEDMIADENEMLELHLALEAENNPPPELVDFDYDLVQKIASDIVNKKVFGVDEYLTINKELLEISKEAQKSLVTVSGLTSGINWMNNPFENKVQTTGVIVGTTSGREILVLANITAIKNSDSIELAFVNDRNYPAEIKNYDDETGLAILSVLRVQLDAATLEAIKPIKFGSSAALSITGMPVIAIGRIIANANSIYNGYITSANSPIDKVDATYKLLTTDLYGSTNASGILINMKGDAIGIIDSGYNTSDARNIISAIGISELNNLILAMMYNRDKPYLGIKGSDVPAEAYEAGVPRGAYVTDVVSDSPAMEAGLQRGDIIVKIEEADIITFLGLVNTLFDYRPDQVIRMTVKRQGLDEYQEFEIVITAGYVK